MFKLLFITAIFAVSTANSIFEKVDIDPTLSWRVVGGNDAPVGAFPFIVSIRLLNDHYCGGVIISPNYVLTATHCAKYESIDYTIVAGSNQLNSGGISYNVSEIITHNNYSNPEKRNDIALFRTSSPIDLSNKNISAIALPQENPGANVDVILAGWGTLQNGGSIPNNLQYLNSRTISYEDCKARLSPNPVHESHVCAFTSSGQRACHGDSGGPLVSLNNTLIGLVSWGIPCGRGYPDVYTNVFSFLDWINVNIKD